MHVCLHEVFHGCLPLFYAHQGSAQSEAVCLLRPGVSDQCRTGLFGGPIGCVYLCTGLITRKRREAELLRS